MADNMMDQDESGAAGIADSEGDIVDDVTDFIDMNDAVEIQVDDDLPMEDDDGNGMLDKTSDGNADGDNGIEETVADMSNFQLRSHTDSVYSVASFVENGELSILSGGGDDKAFQYKISAANGERSTVVSPLSHLHTDTVSSVAYNIQYIGSDPKKTPRLAAVGSYDGTIVIYDADTGTQKLKLEGPSDVEWMSFHPKGGTVLLTGSGDGTLWMFHIPLNRCLQVFVGHEQAVTAGCFSPDGKWALSASSDGTLRIWAPKTGLNKHVFRLGEAGLTCMANKGGSDGMLVIAGSEDGQAHVCHIGS
jgi:WD40 repeat protein